LIEGPAALAVKARLTGGDPEETVRSSWGRNGGREKKEKSNEESSHFSRWIGPRGKKTPNPTNKRKKETPKHREPFTRGREQASGRQGGTNAALAIRESVEDLRVQKRRIEVGESMQGEDLRTDRDVAGRPRWATGLGGKTETRLKKGELAPGRFW